MKLRLLITPTADADLLRNSQWWAENYSQSQAEDWYLGFSEAIERIPDSPNRHPLARENPEFTFELRALHFGVGHHPTHRALFTVREDTVLVIAIRGAAQSDISPNDV